MMRPSAFQLAIVTDSALVIGCAVRDRFARLPIAAAAYIR